MFLIKKLDIFIAKQFGLLFIATFFICQFVLMMQFLWRYVDELIGKGLSLDILAQFFWYMGIMLMPQAFPLSGRHLAIASYAFVDSHHDSYLVDVILFPRSDRPESLRLVPTATDIDEAEES